MTVIPDLVYPSPHLIFRLLFLRVQDIMQSDRGFLRGRRHLMYVTVTTTDHWPRPDHRRVCLGGMGEGEGGLNRMPACALSCHKWHVSQTFFLYTQARSLFR